MRERQQERKSSGRKKRAITKVVYFKRLLCLRPSHEDKPDSCSCSKSDVRNESCHSQEKTYIYLFFKNVKVHNLFYTNSLASQDTQCLCTSPTILATCVCLHVCVCMCPLWSTALAQKKEDQAAPFFVWLLVGN